MISKQTIKSFAFLALLSSAACIDAAKAKKTSAKKEASNVIEINKQEEFDSYIKGDALVIIKFYSPNCGHCKAIKNSYVELANEYDPKEVVFLAVNGDAAGDAGQIAEDYNITGYPTFIFVKDGKVVHKQMGSLPSSQEIKKYSTASEKKAAMPKKKTIKRTKKVVTKEETSMPA